MATRPENGLNFIEYGCEGLLIGTFMFVACLGGVMLEHPVSPIIRLIPSDAARRMLFGLAMGVTAVALIYSPAGRRSGAHMNPAVTLSFYRLGKLGKRDAVAYIAAQCLGATGGVLLAKVVFGPRLGHPAVNYVVTVPGPSGVWVALAAEFAISFILFGVVLLFVGHKRWAPFTGYAAGLLVAAFIFFEAPLSGMSMNPARSLGSALPAHTFTAFWVYIVSPVAGMQLAAYFGLRHPRIDSLCAKLVHREGAPCHFCKSSK